MTLKVSDEGKVMVEIIVSVLAGSDKRFYREQQDNRVPNSAQSSLQTSTAICTEIFQQCLTGSDHYCFLHQK